jgi:hypothetical protein
VQSTQQFAELSIPRDDFRKVLAETLRTLVCPGPVYLETIDVVRGGGFGDQLASAGPEAKSLLEDLLDKDSKACPIARKLTDADRIRLAKIKGKFFIAGGPPSD